MDALLAQEVMETIHNRFVVSIQPGTYTVSNGSIAVDLADGQWYWVQGSVFNDGLHQHPATDLVDETFTGSVQGLAIPRTFEALLNEMEEWTEAHPVTSGYASESFGGYSYTMPTNEDGTTVTVWDVFGKRLNRWRRLPCS